MTNPSLASFEDVYTNMTCNTVQSYLHTDTTCNGKYWSATTGTFNDGIDSASSTLTGGERAIEFAFSGDEAGETGTLTSTKNFKGEAVKIDIRSTGSTSSPTSSVGGHFRINFIDEINNKKISLANYTFSGEGNSFDYKFTFEVIPSETRPDLYTAYLNGIKTNIFEVTDMSEAKLLIEVRGAGNYYNFDIHHIFTNVRFQKLFGCQFEPGELLAMESFGANQDVSLFSTRYEVQRFCLDHPAILTDASEGGSTASTEILRELNNGKVISTTDDQTLTLFYILKNDGSITASCAEKAYDVNTQQCVTPQGIVQICSQGVFDPNTGTCVVTPGVEQLCPEGGRFDAQLAKCVYNPPIQYICDGLGTYSAIIGKCEYSLEGATCPSGTTKEGSVCVSAPIAQILCPAYYAYDSLDKKCVRHNVTAEQCAGTYDATNDICKVSIISDVVCAKGILSSDNMFCIYDADTSTQCPGEWSLGVCKTEPKYDVLCPGGWTVANGKLECYLTPGAVVTKERWFSWISNELLLLLGVALLLLAILFYKGGSGRFSSKRLSAWLYVTKEGMIGGIIIGLGIAYLFLNTDAVDFLGPVLINLTESWMVYAFCMMSGAIIGSLLDEAIPLEGIFIKRRRR